MIKPKFFIVGQPKAGTTALYEMLRQHPQLHMWEARKEAHYFSTDLQVPGSCPLKSDADYLREFQLARPGQIAGEATPLYLRSYIAARRIADMSPDARIIILLREPAELLRSLHNQNIKNHFETEPDLRAALAQEGHKERIPESSRWHVDRLLRYSEHVRYVEQIERYSRVFPKDQIFIGLYDEFRASNLGFAQRVMGFLGVDPSVAVEPKVVNPSIRARSRALDRLFNGLAVADSTGFRAVRAVAKQVTSPGLRGRIMHRAWALNQTRAPEADPEVMTEIRARYRHEVERLASYLDRDVLGEWSQT